MMQRSTLCRVCLALPRVEFRPQNGQILASLPVV
jgi:hypothetical protein